MNGFPLRSARIGSGGRSSLPASSTTWSISPGISFDHRMTEDSGATVSDVARAFLERGTSSGSRRSGGNRRTGQHRVARDTDRALPRCSTYGRTRRRLGCFVTGIRRWTSAMRSTRSLLGWPSWPSRSTPSSRVDPPRRSPSSVASWIAAGVPVSLAQRSARWRWLHSGFDIVEVAHSERTNVADAAGRVSGCVRRVRS